MKPCLCQMLIAKLLLCIIPKAVAQPGEDGSFFNPAIATDPSNDFNPVWMVSQTQNIQWTTTLANFTIFLFQQIGLGSATQGPGIFAVLPGHESATSFDWTVQPNNFDLSRSNIFFLWLQPGPAFNGGGMTSQKFNMSFSASTSSSSNIALATNSVPTTASTSTAAPLTTITPTTSSFASASPHASNSSGLSSGTKVGLGLGITLGLAFLVLMGAAGWYFLRKRRNRTRHVDRYPGPEPLSKSELPADRSRYPSRHSIPELPQGQVHKFSEPQDHRPLAELG